MSTICIGNRKVTKKLFSYSLKLKDMKKFDIFSIRIYLLQKMSNMGCYTILEFFIKIFFIPKIFMFILGWETGSICEPVCLTGSYLEPVCLTGSYLEPVCLTGSYLEPVYGTGSYLEPVYGTGSYLEPVYGTGSYLEPVYETGSFFKPVLKVQFICKK
ncbi:Tricalbin [Brachionus plicatilis]|uniref:Tricalbin n=1 Tax=Brachionus plicatilis TaxID=10195 RepID=A0A3M7Q0E5_BRAPC|nr:Tricalbin [Brachionus plicatilis]